MGIKEKSILFIVFSLKGGGTQRMMVNVLNSISIKQKRILYLYNYQPNLALESQLDSNVEIHYCYSNTKNKHLKRLKILAEILRKNDVSKIVSFALNGTYISIVVKALLFKWKIPIIYRMVSIDTALTVSGSFLGQKINEFLYINVLCRYSYRVISQSNYMRKSLVAKNPLLLANKVETIHNLLQLDLIIEKSKEEIDLKPNYFIYVGRFSIEKNVLDIVMAFEKIAFTIDDNIVLMGEGDLRKDIEKYIKNNTIESRVIILDYQKNPYKYMANAKALVLFSSYEGMPNVVLEAMACKTTVIVSDFEGISDIVSDNLTGLIVQRDNIDELSKAMMKVVTDKELCSKIEEAAFTSINDFSLMAHKRYTEVINN